jgi:hypothetical protein
MRLVVTLLLAAIPSSAFAQKLDDAARKQTIEWLNGLEARDGGYHADARGAKDHAPTLRATSAAVRSLKYLGAEVPHKEKHAAFVMSCYDPATGAFAEHGGKPDVAQTSVGVMAAVELGIPREKFGKAMAYLKEHALTFEEVRIAAAAVEAWGVKDCPFELDDWNAVAMKFGEQKISDPKDGGARDMGSVTAYWLRLGEKSPNRAEALRIIREGQREDGGWGKKGEPASDPETTYRVMRALMLLKEKPSHPEAVRKYMASLRKPAGGYATRPTDAASVGGTYYAVMISKWLDEREGN